jgi:hypothetical protein
MSSDQHVVPHAADGPAPLALLLRERALASSPRFIAGQAAAGVVLNGLLAVTHPDRWGIALLGGATVALHALWAVAVQRTIPDPAVTELPDELPDEALATRGHGWWRVRRVAAVTGSLSALALLWAGTVVLLGRWIS